MGGHWKPVSLRCLETGRPFSRVIAPDTVLRHYHDSAQGQCNQYLRTTLERVEHMNSPATDLLHSLGPKSPLTMRTVTADEAGQRIDNFLMRHFKTVPRSRVYSCCARVRCGSTANGWMRSTAFRRAMSCACRRCASTRMHRPSGPPAACWSCWSARLFSRTSTCW